MADENKIDFTVRINREGVGELAEDLTRIDAGAKDVSSAGASAGAALDKLGGAAQEAGDSTREFGATADQAQQSASDLGASTAAVTQGMGDIVQAAGEKAQAIRASVQAEQSEIELQRQFLVLAQGEQQARLKAAQAQGDEAAATRAGNALRQIEAEQLRLTAQSKRAEAAAVQQATDARRALLAAVGPLTTAQQQELQAAENHAKALRVEAAAADQAAQQTLGLGKALDDTAARSGKLDEALGGVGRALAGVFAAGKLIDFAKNSIAVADAYGQMAERIRMATHDEEEYELVRQRALASANTTYRALSEQQELYIRTADALRSMGYETSQVLDINDSFSYLLATNAASAEKGKNAIDAYTKSIQSGKIEVDAWQSILAATPTIVDAIATATGKTAQEVRELGVTGKLSIASLNEGLRQTVDANKAATERMVTTVADAMTRLHNTWSAYIGEANRAGGATEKLVGLINTLTDNLDGVISAAVKAGEVLAVMAGARALSALMAYVTQLSAATAGTVALAGATTGLGGALIRAKVAMEGLAAASKGIVLAALAVEIAEIGVNLYRWKNAADETRAAQKSLDETTDRLKQRLRDVSVQTGVNVTSMQELDAAVAAGALHFDDATQKWVAGAGSARQLATAQNELTLATEASRKAVGDAALAWGSLTEDYTKVNEATKAATDLAARHVEAVKARGEAAVAEARLLGDEAALRKAVGDAAAAEASALVELADKRQTQVNVLRAELDAKETVLKQAPVVTQSQKDEIAKLRELIEERQLDADKARAQALASQANASAKGEEVQALEAATQAARASAIARKGDDDAAISLLQTQKNLASQAEQMARLIGDETTARDMRIKQLQIDIQITNAKAAAMRAEAEGSIAVANATRAELQAKGQLTDVKRAELDASIKVAQAKMQEADAVGKSVALTQQAIDNINRYGNAAGAAGSKGAAATAQIAHGWERVRQATDAATASLSNYAVADKDLGKGVERVGMGFRNKDGMTSDATGNVQQQWVWTRASIIDYLKQAGLDELLAQDLAKQFLNANGQVEAFNNAGQIRWGGRYSTMSSALGKMADFYRNDEKGQFDAAQRLDYLKESRDARLGNATSGNTYVSNVTIDGQRTSLNFSDAESQRQAEALLRRLGNDKRRAA